MGALVRTTTTFAAMAAIGALLAVVPFSAHAANAEGGEASVPDAVIHHVTDAHTLDFENPITGELASWPLPVWKIPVGNAEIELRITRHVVFMWIAAALLVLGLTLVARRRSMVPRGFYSLIETLVKFVRDELAVKNIGKEEADHYVPYLLTAFFFILTMNLLGLIPFGASATGNLAVTAGLALLTFALTLYAGMKAQGFVGYWAHIVPSGVPGWLYPVMIPVELLGLFTKPFALAIRLFANMVAGHLVLFFLVALIFLLPQAPVVVTPISLAFATGIFLLEIFVAFLQAYIFTMLSALFIGMSAHAH